MAFSLATLARRPPGLTKFGFLQNLLPWLLMFRFGISVRIIWLCWQASVSLQPGFPSFSGDFLAMFLGILFVLTVGILFLLWVLFFSQTLRMRVALDCLVFRSRLNPMGLCQQPKLSKNGANRLNMR
jgi:hypothetical protein